MPLFNIFKNKQKKQAHKSINPKIIADVHEKNSLVLSNLSELGVELEMVNLQVGDYLIKDIIIERKTFQDFISSMLNRRLIQQLINMQQYPKKLLILEGKQNRELFENTKLHPNSIKGMILSTCLEMQTPIIFTDSEKETAQYLFLLAKKQLKKKQDLSFHARIPKTREGQKRYVLEAFPNIGPKKADKLIKEFKNLSAIFNASEQELQEILKNQAKNFKELLN